MSRYTIFIKGSEFTNNTDTSKGAMLEESYALSTWAFDPGELRVNNDHRVLGYMPVTRLFKPVSSGTIINEEDMDKYLWVPYPYIYLLYGGDYKRNIYDMVMDGRIASSNLNAVHPGWVQNYIREHLDEYLYYAKYMCSNPVEVTSK